MRVEYTPTILDVKATFRLVQTLFRLVAVSALLLGCKNAPSPFKPIADVKQLMQGTNDPNADAIWDAVD